MMVEFGMIVSIAVGLGLKIWAGKVGAGLESFELAARRWQDLEARLLCLMLDTAVDRCCAKALEMFRPSACVAHSEGVWVW